MKTKEEYKVRLDGPDEKVEFKLGKAFFASGESNDWFGGEVEAVVEVIKTTGLITFGFNLKGLIEIACDRCLDEYPQEIDVVEKLFIKFGNESKEIDEKVVMIPRGEHQLDITPFLNELMILALPLRKVHPDNKDGTPGCNEKMMKELNKHLVEDPEEVIDPRWDELKKLIDNK